MREKLVLIDGHSILNRAFYGVPELTNSEGLHTNAVYGFLNILFKILAEEQPQYLAVAFDLKAPTFRHKMYDAYKGTRKPQPPQLHEQVPVMKEVLTAMGIPLLMKEGYEADDLLGTVAKRMEKEGLDVSVVSGDRDLLQLATEHIMIRMPKTKRSGTEIEDYHAKEVLEKYQVTPPQIIELKAMMGDASDNIPGLPGVGEKTATRLVVAYGTIENAFAHVEEIKPTKAKNAFLDHYDLAVLSKKLATIDTDSPIDFVLEDARITDLYTPEAFVLFKRLEFKNLLGRFQCDAPDQKVEEYFYAVEDFGEAEEVFLQASGAALVSFSVVSHKGEVKGVSLGWEKEKIYYIPVQGFVTGQYLCEKMAEVLEKADAAVTMNVKEQLPYLHVEKKNIFDAAITMYLLNPLKDAYAYEDIAKECLELLIPSVQELLGKEGFGSADDAAVKNAVCYGTYTCLEGKAKLEEKLKESGMWELFKEIEMPLVYTLYDMEKAGIKADGEALRQYGGQLSGRIKELEKTIYDLAGETFNINSPKQLGVILFEKLQLPYGKKTKTGYSTAADVLEKLAPEAPIVSHILEYRQLAKLKSTYADGLAGYIAADGRIHSKFHQTITATGRISSTEPNLQNIPIRMELGRLIRKVFIPEDGFVFVDADYSQIELRVLAHISGDERLIEAYREAQDIHRITASQVFHVPFDEVTPLQRRNAKAVNFGIVYGISSFGLSQDLSISRKEAGEYIEKYFETYPGIKQFLDQSVADAKEKGYVTTLFGRRRPVPELSSSNFMQRSFGERVAMNSPIQGTAADIIKIAMIRVNERLKAEHLRSRLILQVHDELLVEAAKEELDTVKQILAEEMHDAAKLKVCLEIDMHTGENWYEAK